MTFEWDEQKNLKNKAKHGVSFEAAAGVFFDENVLVEPNRVINREERFQAIGMTEGLTIVLFVAFTYRSHPYDEETIRIISARKASKKDRRRYSGLR